MPVEQAYTLIMNPSSGGGRSKQLLPAVERQLDILRMPFRIERTRSLEHGVDLAFEAVDAREIPVVMSGDGLIGAVGGALAGVGTPVGLIPAGRGNDPGRGLAVLPEGGYHQADRCRGRQRKAFSRDRLGRLRLRSEQNRKRREAAQGPAGLRIRGLAGAAHLEAGPLHPA